MDMSENFVNKDNITEKKIYYSSTGGKNRSRKYGGSDNKKNNTKGMGFFVFLAIVFVLSWLFFSYIYFA